MRKKPRKRTKKERGKEPMNLDSHTHGNWDPETHPQIDQIVLGLKSSSPVFPARWCSKVRVPFTLCITCFS